ncbi:Uncharacterized protein TCM_024013 [Theobroma cacao]|uniref:Uncharacterized protein n=1 Tax=Theobroma cacao TaxID=3641 RepID=A0A061EVH8_THECC|nr:Uncharacterized protein TCM_024013 [Theobroma cacao]
MRIGLEKWVHACSPTRRYQLMTSNIVECVNSCLKHTRQMLITVLTKFIKDMFQRLFHDCKCKREAIEFCVDHYKTNVLVEGYKGPFACVEHVDGVL